VRLPVPDDAERELPSAEASVQLLTLVTVMVSVALWPCWIDDGFAVSDAVPPC